MPGSQWRPRIPTPVTNFVSSIPSLFDSFIPSFHFMLHLSRKPPLIAPRLTAHILHTTMPRPADSPDVAASKTLSYILRHGAEKEGLHIRSDGLVRLDDVVSCHRTGALSFSF